MAVSASVVIPSLRGGTGLVDLAEKLSASGGTETEVLVADNGLPRMIARDVSQFADVIAMEGNRGFGAAINRAAERARGDALVLINDDVELQDGFLESLVAPLETDAEMVAGVLLFHDDTSVIESAGIVIDRMLGPHDYLAHQPVTRLRQPLDPPLGPCGGVAAYRRSTFAELGGFDEGFFAYFEDVDLALRIRGGGGSCALATNARARHTGSWTLGFNSLAKTEVVGYSRTYLLRKYGGERPAATAAALFVEVGTSLALAKRHRSLRPARARVRGWRECTARASWPRGELVTVGIGEALRARYLRSIRGREH